MSCRSTPAGSALSTIARVESGLHDVQTMSLFHSLRVEGRSAPSPTAEEYQAWVAQQQADLDTAIASYSERRRERVAARLREAAEQDPPDGPTFYAMRHMRDRARGTQDRLRGRLRQIAADLGVPEDEVHQRYRGYYDEVPRGRAVAAVEGYDEVTARTHREAGLPGDHASHVALVRLQREAAAARETTAVAPRRIRRAAISGDPICEAGYDPDGGRLEIVFRRPNNEQSRVYAYQGVPSEVWEHMRTVGYTRGFNSEVRGNPDYQYPSREAEDADATVRRCSGCGQFSGRAHVCPEQAGASAEGGVFSAPGAATPRGEGGSANLRVGPDTAAEEAAVENGDPVVPSEPVSEPDAPGDAQPPRVFEPAPAPPMSGSSEEVVPARPLCVRLPEAETPQLDDVDPALVGRTLVVIDQVSPNPETGVLEILGEVVTVTRTSGEYYIVAGFDGSLRCVPATRLSLGPADLPGSGDTATLNPGGSLTVVTRCADCGQFMGAAEHSCPPASETEPDSEQVATGTAPVPTGQDDEASGAGESTDVAEEAADAQASAPESDIPSAPTEPVAAAAMPVIDPDRPVHSASSMRVRQSEWGWVNRDRGDLDPYRRYDEIVTPFPHTMHVAAREHDCAIEGAFSVTGERRDDDPEVQQFYVENPASAPATPSNGTFRVTGVMRGEWVGEDLDTWRVTTARDLNCTCAQYRDTYSCPHLGEAMEAVSRRTQPPRDRDTPPRPLGQAVGRDAGRRPVEARTSDQLRIPRATRAVQLNQSRSGRVPMDPYRLWDRYRGPRISGLRSESVTRPVAARFQIIGNRSTRDEEVAAYQALGVEPPPESPAGPFRVDGTVEVDRPARGRYDISFRNLRCSCAQYRETYDCPHLREAAEQVEAAIRPATSRSGPAAQTLDPAAAQAAVEAAARDDWTRTAEGAAAARERHAANAEVSYTDDFEAFDQARVEALARRAAGEAPVPFLTSDVTDGVFSRESGRGFGVEIEFDIKPDVDRSAALAAIGQELYDAGLTYNARQSYYGASRSRGYTDVQERGWSFEQDCTVSGEIVSPVCYDEPQTWENLAKVCEIVRRHGGVATARTGSHVHVGMAHTTPQTVTALAQSVNQHEDVLYRMSSNPDRRTHRPMRWCAPNHAVPDGGYADVSSGRMRHAGHQYSLNLQSVQGRESGDHAEIRHWDGTLDPGVIQTQIKVSGALVAAAERNGPVAAADPRTREPVGAHAERLSRLKGRSRRQLTAEEMREDSATTRSLLDTLFTREVDKKQAAALWAVTSWVKRGGR